MAGGKTADDDVISRTLVIDMLEACKTSLDLLWENPEGFEYRESIRNYGEIRKQVEGMQPFTFGAVINVLLITDRLHGCAQGLKEYLQNSSDISVDVVYDVASAQQAIREKPIDFLIVVGFLKDRKKYNVIKYAEQVNKYASVIMYASLDNLQVYYTSDGPLSQGCRLI